MASEFKGQIAIVTGGARGIGRAISITLADRGANVVVADIDLNGARKAVAMMKGRQNLCVQTDISSETSIKQLYKLVMERFGKVDIVVNNAGIFRPTPVLDIDVAEWDAVMAVNLRGTFLMSREALKIMKAQKSGKIINIASMSGKTGGTVAGAHYAASKAGVICLTKSFAKQAALYKVNVNAITPGLIKSDLTEAWGAKTNRSLADGVPLKEFGQPQDVAEAVAFLASDKARYIVGEILDVNGGILMD